MHYLPFIYYPNNSQNNIFIDYIYIIYYILRMYATEKYVKAEAKELRESFNQLAADLGGDIRYLDERLSELYNLLVTIQQRLDDLEK